MWSLDLTTGVENNESFITLNFVQLKLKNTRLDIEDEVVETFQVIAVDDIDRYGK